MKTQCLFWIVQACHTFILLKLFESACITLCKGPHLVPRPQVWHPCFKHYPATSILGLSDICHVESQNFNTRKLHSLYNPTSILTLQYKQICCPSSVPSGPTLTIGSLQVGAIISTGLVGELLGDGHVAVDLLPKLLQHSTQVTLPVLFVQHFNQLGQLDLCAVVPYLLVVVFPVFLTVTSEGKLLLQHLRIFTPNRLQEKPILCI